MFVKLYSCFIYIYCVCSHLAVVSLVMFFCCCFRSSVRFCSLTMFFSSEPGRQMRHIMVNWLPFTYTFQFSQFMPAVQHSKLAMFAKAIAIRDGWLIFIITSRLPSYYHSIDILNEMNEHTNANIGNTIARFSLVIILLFVVVVVALFSALAVHPDVRLRDRCQSTPSFSLFFLMNQIRLSHDMPFDTRFDESYTFIPIFFPSYLSSDISP